MSEHPAPGNRPSSWGTVVVGTLMVGYAVLLAVALFSPSSQVQSSLVVDVSQLLQRIGVPDALVTEQRTEMALNAVIVAPLSLLGSLLRPQLRWQDWVAYGFVASLAVEVLQGLLLAGRDASATDVVANTAGALLGAVLATAWTRGRRNRAGNG